MCFKTIETEIKITDYKGIKLDKSYTFHLHVKYQRQIKFIKFSGKILIQEQFTQASCFACINQREKYCKSDTGSTTIDSSGKKIKNLPKLVNQNKHLKKLAVLV